MTTLKAQVIKIDVRQSTPIKGYTTCCYGQETRTRLRAETPVYRTGRHSSVQARTRYFVCNQRGIAFVIALIMLLVLTLIGVGSISMTTYENNIAGNERLYNLAFYAADGGVENFRGRISTGEFIYTAVDKGSYQVKIGENPCDVSYSRTSYSDGAGSHVVFKITSEGKAPFPAQGKVIVESVVEAPMQKPEGYN